MNKNPSVSVIVPIYNDERHIKICVDSILNQTFQDFEIILVDDASSDNSYTLCQKLYGDNDKVKLVRHEVKRGLDAARNTGLEHACGKYITLVESHNFITPDALEKFYAAAENDATNAPTKSAAPTDLEALQYVKTKYSAFLDSLPRYQSDGGTPKIFWWCWLQGVDNAPPISKMCLKALRRNYSDYQINVVTLKNVSEYVSFPEHVVRKFKAGKITPTHFSDLLRLELLIKYGGIWADSTVLATGREKDYLREPLFIFQSTWRNEVHLGSSWFIVACKGNPILKTTRDLLYKYWEDHDAVGAGGFYFLFHWMFRLAVAKYPDEWAKVPLFSNIPPHVLQMEFFKPYNPDRFEQIRSMSHFHKLSWKYQPELLASAQLAGTNYDYLMKFYA